MDFPAWEQATSRVMYCFVSRVGDQLLNYIRDTKMPTDACKNLKRVFAASTVARNLQLKQELSNVRQRDMSVADYTSKIKEICNSLASINAIVEEDEMVHVCLEGLASKFRSFQTVA